jgi:protein phosphatase
VTGTDPTATAAVTTLPPHRRFDDSEVVAEHPPPRRFTLRVLLFVVAALAVLAIAALAIGWFATRTYFVAFDGEQVAIFRGRPGGLLWFEPSVAEAPQPPLQRAGLVEALCNRIDGQPSATDLGDARRIIEQLRADQAALPPPTSPCGAAG